MEAFWRSIENFHIPPTQKFSKPEKARRVVLKLYGSSRFWRTYNTLYFLIYSALLTIAPKYQTTKYYSNCRFKTMLTCIVPANLSNPMHSTRNSAVAKESLVLTLGNLELILHIAVVCGDFVRRTCRHMPSLARFVWCLHAAL